MKRVRVEIEVIRRTHVEFEVEDETDNEEIRETALDEAELADWEEEPPEVVSIEIMDPSWGRGCFFWGGAMAERYHPHHRVVLQRESTPEGMTAVIKVHKDDVWGVVSDLPTMVDLDTFNCIVIHIISGDELLDAV
jgi:hypothetical protein